MVRFASVPAIRYHHQSNVLFVMVFVIGSCFSALYCSRLQLNSRRIHHLGTVCDGCVHVNVF